MGSERKILPICLTNVQAVAEESLWVEHVPGRSVKYFVLPRPLLWACRFWHEGKGLFVSAELHLMDHSCFLEGSDAYQQKQSFARLAIFTRVEKKEKETPYVFQCADIVNLDEDEENLMTTVYSWAYLEIIPNEWQSERLIGVRAKLVW